MVCTVTEQTAKQEATGNKRPLTFQYWWPRKTKSGSVNKQANCLFIGDGYNKGEEFCIGKKRGEMNNNNTIKSSMICQAGIKTAQRKIITLSLIQSCLNLA